MNSISRREGAISESNYTSDDLRLHDAVLASAESPLYTYFCPHCGRDAVVWEARARWQPESHSWEFWMEKGVNAWCQECGEEIGQEVEFGVPEVRHG